MTTEIVRKSRSKKDRRQSKEPYHGPERRSGKDRRKLDKRLKQLIDENEKKQAVTKRIKFQSGKGNVIRRRKNELSERVGQKSDKDDQ